ncbi:MAG: NADH-quinone oxidoreductase subunit D [Actinobacteria bacterium]|nr:NADH-quinone oxidoreductase subunit D [Actinomycetota bacterium]
MDQLPVLSVVVPLLVAAGIAACGWALRPRRRVLDGIGIATCAGVVAMLAVLMTRVARGDEVYWFAGFRPHENIAVGIDFAAGSLSTGLACLAGILVLSSMIFSWRYFDEVSTYFQTLMLTFLAGMVGFCLTGDVFNLFVWFELMGVSAYALTAYRSEERGPLQGALNFAITNSVGAYLMLSGIAVVYGWTGALNMAQIGVSLARHRPDGLVVVAFVLIISGLLIKSAIVPFQFWLADAHAVAPTPVCVLFSGVMVELGLYGIARVYWSMFGDALGHRAAITTVLEVLGLTTALVGALFCFRERHIKRLLAFSTISHSGLFLTGIALLTPLGLTGAAVYVIGHALVKGALFLCVGIVLHRLGSVNESWLHGRGRRLRVTGLIFTVAAIGLADMPAFATWLGKGWIEDGSDALGRPWITVLFVAASILVGGAVLRVAGGVFFGLGDPPREDRAMAKGPGEETGETKAGRQRTPLSMLAPAAALAVGSLVIGLIPGLGRAVEAAAVRFQDQPGYNAAVLHGLRVAHPVALSSPAPAVVTLPSLVTGFGSVVASIALALGALYWRRLPVLGRHGLEPGAGLAGFSRSLQSGVVNDYVTWTVLGLACIGGALALALR